LPIAVIHYRSGTRNEMLFLGTQMKETFIVSQSAPFFTYCPRGRIKFTMLLPIKIKHGMHMQTLTLSVFNYPEVPNNHFSAKYYIHQMLYLAIHLIHEITLRAFTSLFPAKIHTKSQQAGITLKHFIQVVVYLFEE